MKTKWLYLMLAGFALTMVILAGCEKDSWVNPNATNWIIIEWIGVLGFTIHNELDKIKKIK